MSEQQDVPSAPRLKVHPKLGIVVQLAGRDNEWAWITADGAPQIGRVTDRFADSQTGWIEARVTFAE